jgi:predicted nucleotidyltransferase
MTVEYTFEDIAPGTEVSIACRVRDGLGGEGTKTTRLKVKQGTVFAPWRLGARMDPEKLAQRREGGGMRTPTVDMQEIIRRIVETAHPRRVILFGSRGRGRGRPNSDWDILVIADSKRPRHERAAPLYGALSDLRQQVDILVYTPEEVEEWKNVSQALVTTATREGKVLYEEP